MASEPDGLGDLIWANTAVVNSSDVTLLPSFIDCHERLMEASRNTLLVPMDRARSVNEFTNMISEVAPDQGEP